MLEPVSSGSNVLWDILWQLEYPGGLLRTEPLQGETILHAPRGYKALRLVTAQGSPVQRIEIPSKSRPIFYRIRSASPGDKEPILDAIVFGYGSDYEYIEYGKTIEGRVWMWHPRLNKALEVPRRYYDQAMILYQLKEPVGV